MERKELILMLQDFGRALAENQIPLTFFVGGDVEFGRTDILNDTEPGKLLKGILEKETSKALGVDMEYVDELLVTYYLMMNTSVLIEHTDHSVATGQYQPSIDRGVFTLCEDEVRYMHKLHGVKQIPDKAWRDLENTIAGISANYNISKIKALRLDWLKCKTTNPRSLMKYDDGIHIIPTDVLVGYHSKMREMIASNVYKFTYKRVNVTDRVQYVTLNKDAINEIYKEDLRFANDFYEVSTPRFIQYHGVATHIEVLQGLWSIADLGLSRFVMSPKRRISLSRIIEFKLIDEKDLNDIKKYVNVDIENVVDMFIFYATQFDEQQTDRVMRDLNCTTPDLIQFIQTQATILTTMYSKMLHDYMVINQELFKGYTGVKVEQFENSYNIGNSEIKFGSTDSIDF